MISYEIFKTYAEFILNQQKKVDNLSDALNKYNIEFLQLSGMVLPYEEKMVEMLRDVMGLKPEHDDFFFDFFFDPFRYKRNKKDLKKFYNEVMEIVNSYDKKSMDRNKKKNK